MRAPSFELVLDRSAACSLADRTVRSPLARGDTIAMTFPPCSVAEAGTLSQFLDGFGDR